MRFSENTIKVIEVLRAKNGMDLTTKHVADETGLNVRQVVAIFNAIVRKGLGFRQEINGEKILRLTQDAMTIDLYADDEE